MHPQDLLDRLDLNHDQFLNQNVNPKIDLQFLALIQNRKLDLTPKFQATLL